MTGSSNVHQLFSASPVLLNRHEEQRLVMACLDGNRPAMESLVKHYERPVYNVAFRMLGNTQDAADVAQTTFLKVFQKLDQYDPQYKLFSWVYRIAMNESIDMLKQRPRSEPLRDERPAATPEPAELVNSDEVNTNLRRAIAELSEDYRDVIALKYFTDNSYEQIATILGVAEKTVKSRLYTARQNLREILIRQGHTAS